MSTNPSKNARLILNGKASANVPLRAAVKHFREQGCDIQVRVTWEGGDAQRLAEEAVRDEFELVIAAGGDGTINEVANGMMQAGESNSTLGIIPFGTANDFATSCGIPKGDPHAALEVALTTSPIASDIGLVNGRYFVNVVSGGFGAEVTANTPPEMKKALGGAAYSLMGVVTAAKMSPYETTVTLPDGQTHSGSMLIMAVGNGRQCGGGFEVTPSAKLNDGLLDFLVIHDAAIKEFGRVLSELAQFDDPNNQFVSYAQAASLKLNTTTPLQVNLDGEPMRDTEFQFAVADRRLPIAIPVNDDSAKLF